MYLSSVGTTPLTGTPWPYMPAVETPLSPKTVALYLTAPCLIPRYVATRPSFQMAVMDSAVGVEVQDTFAQPGPMMVYRVSMLCSERVNASASAGFMS